MDSKGTLEKKKIRESNIELCRIVCMLLIIAHHSVIHGGAIDMNLCLNKYIAFFLVPGGKLCFVTFMVISTWFLVEQKFKWQRFIKTWLEVLFYSVLFTFVSSWLGTPISKKNWVSVFFPIIGNSHGFAATYLAFYLLIPFLAMIRDKITHRQLLLLITILSYYQIFSRMLGRIDGYNPSLVSSELTLFILFYFISLYLRRYPVRFFANKKFLIGLFIGIWLSIFTIWCLSLSGFAKTFRYAALSTVAQDESSILYILGGYVLFYIFNNFKIKNNKLINFMASASFGVLLFHDHNFFRYQLWQNILNAPQWYYKETFVLWVIICTLGIFIIGMLIDLVRRKIENKIFSEDTTNKLISKLQGYFYENFI